MRTVTQRDRFCLFAGLLVFVALLACAPWAVQAGSADCAPPAVASGIAKAAPDDCPVFNVPPVSVDVICTPQEYKEHTFMDTIVTNTSASSIAGYSLVVALYDANGTLLASQRVERKARKGALAPGESQDERFIVVDVPPIKVAKVEFTPVPR